jgi:hypothetical protein
LRQPFAFIQANVLESQNGFSYTVPLRVIQSVNARATSLGPETSARLPNGSPLPSWLTYAPNTRTFTSQLSPSRALPFRVALRIPNQDGETKVVLLMLE